MSINWDAHEESEAAIEEALQSVHKKVEHKKHQRKVRRTLASSSAGLAAIAVLALVAFNGSGTPNLSSGGGNQIAQPGTSVVTQPQLSLAARVTKAASDALTSANALAATEHTVNYNVTAKNDAGSADYYNLAGDATTQFRATNDGSYWESIVDNSNGVNSNTAVSYSKTSGKYTQCQSNSQTPENCSTDWGPMLLQSSLGQFYSVVNQAANGTDITASDNKTAGQNTWTLQYDTHPNMSTATMHIKLDVDQTTGMPTHLVTTVNGKPNSEVTLTDLVVNPTFKATELHVQVPKGIQVTDFTAPGTLAPLVVKFGSKPAAALPTATAPGYTTDEVWTTAQDPKIAKINCDAAIGNTSGTFLEQVSRNKFLNYQTKVIDQAVCPVAFNIPDNISDMNNAVLLKTVTATDGVLKGTKFEIYRQSDGKIFIGGASAKYIVYATGDESPDDAVAIVNGFKLN